VWQHPIPSPRQCLVIPLCCARSDVREIEACDRGITQWLSAHRVFGHGHGLCHTSQGHISPRVYYPSPLQVNSSVDSFVYRFPEWNEAPDFSTFSSLLRITAKYQMPTVRSRVLKVIRDAYPVTFEGLDPSKALGENVFSRPTPHPNAVLNLFVQQNLTSALPMAYYMAVRRGPGSLLDDRLPASARLPPKILQAAITGLFVLRGMELKETRRLIFGPKGSRYCSRPNCPSCYPPGQGFSEAHHKIADRIADSVELHSGTKLLQVLSLREICGDDGLGFCEGCVKAWEAGHADVRKKAWAALPDVFGLKV